MHNMSSTQTFKVAELAYWPLCKDERLLPRAKGRHDTPNSHGFPLNGHRLNCQREVSEGAQVVMHCKFPASLQQERQSIHLASNSPRKSPKIHSHTVAKGTKSIQDLRLKS